MSTATDLDDAPRANLFARYLDTLLMILIFLLLVQLYLMGYLRDSNITNRESMSTRRRHRQQRAFHQHNRRQESPSVVSFSLRTRKETAAFENWRYIPFEYLPKNIPNDAVIAAAIAVAARAYVDRRLRQHDGTTLALLRSEHLWERYHQHYRHGLVDRPGNERATEAAVVSSFASSSTTDGRYWFYDRFHDAVVAEVQARLVCSLTALDCPDGEGDLLLN
ncbi:hypothetical protein C7999DRAFT_31865 [Corynascus novoguineensis]|uniref:Uncharacterized protein n=1 Tax=Corynascus novoguineensis TaxID=1126955 RepID=A0AAN7CTN7_9PEZI|nr:hypothetical protein C7999DRAFT_31865 [Corynascus novoguineensis]